MMRHTHDGGVYVRSMASRGQLGGLSSAVPAALRILAGFGFDRLIVETVGVGQVELDVARTADCAVVVIAPGFGDHIQASKAGLIEVADVFVINKADRPGADEAVADLTMAIDLGQPHGWRPAVIPCAAETGSGIGEVWAALEAFRMFQESQDVLEARRRDRRLSQLRSALGALVQRRVDAFVEDAGNAEILAAVADGTVNATDAAERMFDHLCSASM
jgi:LAO/AO transport system kinase